MKQKWCFNKLKKTSLFNLTIALKKNLHNRSCNILDLETKLEYVVDFSKHNEKERNNQSTKSFNMVKNKASFKGANRTDKN